jgi:hypothetical protein
MGAAVAIRADIEAAELRRLPRRERDGRVAARLIALANALDGMGRGAAARAAGMDRQTLRDSHREGQGRAGGGAVPVRSFNRLGGGHNEQRVAAPFEDRACSTG